LIGGIGVIGGVRNSRRYMKMLTLLDASAIADAMQTHSDDPGERTGQRMLATEVTRQVLADLALILGFLRAPTASAVFAAVKSHEIIPVRMFCDSDTLSWRR
jgi:hypothetical protein